MRCFVSVIRCVHLVIDCIQLSRRSLNQDEEARENKMSDDLVPSSEDENEMSEDESEEEDEVRNQLI